MARILVVDDEPDERFLLRRMFERDGHEVIDASDGAAALAIVRESPPGSDRDRHDDAGHGRRGAHPAAAERPRDGGHSDPGRRPAIRVSRAPRTWSCPSRTAAAPRRGGVSALLTRKDVTRLKLMLTGIAGLDLVLNGGLERGSVVVLAGAPGTGKTILAQQICFAKATAAHKAVYYTTVSEPHTKLVRHLEPFAFFDPESLGTTVEYIHLGSFLRPAEPGRAGAAGLGDRPENAGGRARHRGGRQHQDAARLCRRTRAALRALRPDQPHRPHRHGAAAGR